MSNNYNKGAWSPEEHARYVQGLQRFGADFQCLTVCIKTRSTPQIRYYHDKQKKKQQAAAAASPSQAKKRKTDAPASDSKKKAKAKGASLKKAPAKVSDSAASSPVARAATSTSKPTPIALSNPAISSPSQVSVDDSILDQKPPPIIPLPEIEEEPAKAAPSISMKQNEAAKEEAVAETPQEESAVAVEGAKCPVSMAGLKSLLENDFIQHGLECVLGGLLGFLTLQVLKKFVL